MPRQTQAVQREARQDPNVIPEDKFPHDLGLFQGTLIMPTGARKPSFASSPVGRAKLELFRLKHRWHDLRSLASYKMGTNMKPRPKLEFRKIKSTALALHQRLFSAVAEGDASAIDDICCEGLRDQLKKQIELRPGTERMQWTVKYTGFPQVRVVSSRGSMLPRKNSALRQAVIKIKSQQTLTRLKRDENGEEQVSTDIGKVKSLQEYLVLQRRIFDGVEGPWKVWGTTKETNTDDIPELATEKRGDAAVAPT